MKLTVEADVYPKRGHRDGCTGQLYRWGQEWLDATGRKNPNGSSVGHVYKCNMRWDGCDALVYVPERSMRQIAVQSIGGES